MIITVKESHDKPQAEVIFEYAGHTFTAILPLAEIESLSTDLEQVSQILRSRFSKERGE